MDNLLSLTASVFWGSSVVDIPGSNDAIVSEQSILREKQGYKSFLHIAVNLNVLMFWGLDTHGDRKLTHTHKPTATLAAHTCMPGINS